MTKAHHPARRARNLTGAVSALALVGMVTGFQFAAAAESQNAVLAKDAIPAPGQTGSSTAGSTAGAPTVDQSGTVTADGTSATQSQATVAVVDSGAAPAPAVDPAPAPAPAVDPAPAPPAPAPAPAVDPAPAPPAPAPAPAPPSGTTSGS